MLAAARDRRVTHCFKKAARLCRRNALGAVVAATALRRIGEMDLALLELEVPLAATGFEPAPRDAFAGSAAFALEYPAADNAAPAWPVLRVGFIGRRTLGIELPPGPGGGPVLDGAAQRFEGGAMLWLPQPDGPRTILVLATPESAWREYPD
jgi:hypothetical protein